MKASEKLRADLGHHIAESIETDRRIPAHDERIPAHNGPGRLAGVERLRGAMLIPLDRVVPDPTQPRREFDQDALERLAGSLRDRGQVQPCRVRWDEGQGIYVIISGERRWRAAKLAGLTTLQCVEVQGEPTDDQILDDQLTENCLREDLGAIEQAAAFRALMAKRGWSQAKLAQHLHVSQPTVSRALALLDLPEQTREAVGQGRISPERARAGAAPPTRPVPWRLTVRGVTVTIKGAGAVPDPEALLALQEAARVVRARLRAAGDDN